MITGLTKALNAIQERRAATQAEIEQLLEPQRRLAALQAQEAQAARDLAELQAEIEKLQAENAQYSEYIGWMTPKAAGCRAFIAFAREMEQTGIANALGIAPGNLTQSDWNNAARTGEAMLERLDIDIARRAKNERRLKELSR